MSNFFSKGSYLSFFEQQMQEPPGYRQRGQGIFIYEQTEWQSHSNYEQIVDIVITRMQMEQLKHRLEQIFSNAEKEFIFKDQKHRKDFYSLMKGKRKEILQHTPNYAGAVFLLSADEELWTKVAGNVLDTGIYFKRIKIGRLTLEQYILYHAAKDIYNGTKHIQLSELADQELIPDEIFRLIINAFVINKCGLEVLEWEDRNIAL